MDDFDFIDEDDEIYFEDEPDTILDEDFLQKHFNIVPQGVIENFPFVEDNIDAITDYELFTKGFDYLDEKKADKDDIPLMPSKVSQLANDVGYITKDVNDLTNYTKTSELATVATTGDYDDLINKPTIPDVSNFITKDVDDLTYYTKSSELATVATTGDYDDLLNKPTIPDVSNFITKDVDDLTYYTKSSELATVATTGDYDDLLDKPTIPDVSNFITKDVNDLTYYPLSSSLATVATSGNYNDLLNKPIIDVLYNNASGSLVTIDLSSSCANYDYVEVFYNTEDVHKSLRVYNPDTKEIDLTVNTCYNTSNYIKSSKWKFNGNKLEYEYGNQFSITSSGVGSFTGTSNGVKVTRVLGYK